MSRIGKQPITIPSGITVELKPGLIVVNGTKGTLEVPYFDGLEITLTEGVLEVACVDMAERPKQGLQRTLIQNAVTGVSTGWDKSLELNGVGMRAAMAGAGLNLSLGFSHPVAVEAPAGVQFQVVKNVITVSGTDKQLVGETAANIRKLRKPEPYKGKGIRYVGEVVRRKAGKTGKAK
ncbi:MAG: 50S ribosomal protein L6 [bacterium]